MGKRYGHEDRGKIEDALLRLKETICGTNEVGTRAANIKLMSNGDISGIFLIDDGGSVFHIIITDDGDHVDSRFLDDFPFEAMLEEEGR